MAFKYIGMKDQLLKSQAEIERLKAIVGDVPVQDAEAGEIGEDPQESPKLADRVIATETKVVTIEETIDVLFGGAK